MVSTAQGERRHESSWNEILGMKNITINVETFKKINYKKLCQQI